MKGIAHFAVGVATASCFPASIQAAVDGNPFYFVAGGVFGLLPDTLDFKFYRFFYKYDAEVVLDPLSPDPQLIASALADAVSYSLEHNKPFRIRINTIRLGSDTWQSFKIRFNRKERQVEVALGAVIDTGGVPCAEPVGGYKVATASLAENVRLEYLAETSIGAFEGPMFRISPGGSGDALIEFIPWHRAWSHSFSMALVFAALLWPVAGIAAAAVAAAAYSAHIVVDQLGYMGSNLWWPFSNRRTPGMKMLHSGNAFANFYTVWLACLLIFVNLTLSLSPRQTFVDLFSITVWAMVIPLIIRGFLRLLPK